MAIEGSVIKQVSDELGAYVYVLADPDTGIPFYVGKGQGARHTSHLAEARNSERLAEALADSGESPEAVSRKVATIKAIAARGSDSEPEVWIVRYGLTRTEYTAVEAALIDLLMTFPIRPRCEGEVRVPLCGREQLTNARRESADGHGVVLLRTLIDDHAAPPLTTTTQLLLITLNGWLEIPGGEAIAGGQVRHGAGWKREWLVSSVREKSFQEIGESVSGWWRIDLGKVGRRGIEHVAAVHRGVTRALFRIEPGSWEARTGDPDDESGKPIIKRAFRFQVIGSGQPLFADVVGPHGHRVPARVRGDQGSVHYWPSH